MEQKKDLIGCLSIIRDPRVLGRSKYELVEILIIVICAVLSGAEGWEEIEEFGCLREEWLRSFLKLENGIPSHDTIARVLSIIDTEELGKSFIEWVSGKIRKGRKHIAIDGKTVRGSRNERKGQKAVHMIQALATEEGILLGQKETAEKSNEITAIPELLKILEIKGCVITIDAMGCQKKIVEKIIEKKSDYVLAVKENQAELSGEIQEYFTEQLDTGFKNAVYDYYESSEKGHGRQEVRKYWTIENIEWLQERNEWQGIKSIGLVESSRTIKGQTTIQRRYYITSLKGEAKEFARAVRNHWKVESCHWILDVSFREDESQKRVRQAAKNFAMVRRIAFNILKSDKTSKRRIVPAKQIRVF